MLTLLLEGLGHHVVFQVGACLLMKDDGVERRGRHFHGRHVQAILTRRVARMEMCDMGSEAHGRFVVRGAQPGHSPV